MFSRLFHTKRGRVLAATAVGAAIAVGAWFSLRDTSSNRVPSAGNDQLDSALPHATQRAGLCSSANAPGVGLRGDYFTSAGLAGVPQATRIDTTVDFTGALVWPTDPSASPPRSVRWQGWIRAPLNGRYRFHAEPAGARIYVSREAMTGPGAAPDASIELTVGRFYPILMEVPALSDALSRVSLEWTAPHGARFVIPRALLYLPTETAAPAPPPPR